MVLRGIQKKMSPVFKSWQPFYKANPFKIIKKGLVLLTLFIFPLILAGCVHQNIPFLGGKDEGGGGPVTLKYWGLWEPKQVIQPLIDKYQKTHPGVTIVYEQQSPKDYRDKLVARIPKGDGPDIFRFHNTWVPSLKDILSPLPKSAIDDSTFLNTFYPVASSDLKVGKDFVGLPLEFDGLGLFWNVDLFQAAGYTEPPRNWDELRRIARDLTVVDPSGRLVTGGVALGSTGNVDHFSDILALMMFQNGVDLTRIDSSLDVNGRNLGADAMDFFILFGREGIWNKNVEPSTLAFAKGRLAMMFAPSWKAFQLIEANPSLNFKVAQVPQLPDLNVAWASYWVEGVSAKSKNQKEAWEFLKFMVQSENLQQLYTEASKIRRFGEPYPRVDMAKLLQNDPIVGAFVKDAANARSFPFASRTFDNGLNDRSIKSLEDALNSVVNKEKTSKEALEIVRRSLDQILSQFGVGLKK